MVIVNAGIVLRCIADITMLYKYPQNWNYVFFKKSMINKITQKMYTGVKLYTFKKAYGTKNKQ